MATPVLRWWRDRAGSARARALLGETDVRDAVARLPFVPGDRVVALGDSLTVGPTSWAAQLRAVLVRTGAGVEVVEAAVSGATTRDLLARTDVVAALRPSWVLLLTGTNDVRRHDGRRELTLAQSLEASRALTGRLQEQGARVVRLLPPPVVDARVVTWRPFLEQRLGWRAEDVQELAAALLHADPAAVDLHGALAAELAHSPTLLQPDGVHLTVPGQTRVLVHLLRALAAR